MRTTMPCAYRGHNLFGSLLEAGVRSPVNSFSAGGAASCRKVAMAAIPKTDHTSIMTRPFSTTTLYVLTGTMHGGWVTSPVRMSKQPWWKSHSISWPSR